MKTVSWRSTAGWLLLSVGLTGAGLLVARVLSKSIGDMGVTSFDTLGSRLGIAVAGTGVAIVIATLATLPQRLGWSGSALVLIATFVAAWLMISEPTVVARTSAYPVPHETSCRPAAIVHAVAQSEYLTRSRSTDALAKCRSVSRIQVGVGCGAAVATWAGALIWLRRKPASTQPQPAHS